MVTEYINGIDLGKYLGKISQKEIIQVGRIICNVLEETHNQNFLHRDIKPENILIPKGVIRDLKIGDFGLAKRTDAGIIDYGSIIGSTGFAAPEQIDYRSRFHVDGRTDIYGLAATLYFMLTENCVYSQEDANRLNSNEHITIPKPKPLTDFGHNPLINDVFMKALMPYKAKRYKEIGEFAEALDHIYKKI